MKETMTNEEKRLCKWIAGQNCEVIEVDGSNPPMAMGRPAYYTTPSGNTVVRHPRAYGWSTVRHCSTIRIEVGRDWLSKNAKLYDLREVHGVKAYYDVRSFIKRTMPGGLEMRAVKSGRGDHWLVTTDDDATHVPSTYLTGFMAPYAPECLWRIAIYNIDKRKEAELCERMSKIKDAIGALQGMQPSAVPVLARHARSTGSCQPGIDEFVRRFKCRSWETAKRLLTIAPANDFVRRAVQLAAFECATTVSI